MAVYLFPEGKDFSFTPHLLFRLLSFTRLPPICSKRVNEQLAKT